MERRSSKNVPGRRNKPSSGATDAMPVVRTHPVVVRASFVRLPRATLQAPATPPTG